MAKRKSTKG